MEPCVTTRLPHCFNKLLSYLVAVICCIFYIICIVCDMFVFLHHFHVLCHFHPFHICYIIFILFCFSSHNFAYFFLPSLSYFPVFLNSCRDHHQNETYFVMYFTLTVGCPTYFWFLTLNLFI